ncbi:MAG: TRAP transporter small permease [Betaproteobacteria bacterium]|nr:TRAP transporter small permease [Betaproteobacteria bacterium]
MSGATAPIALRALGWLDQAARVTIVATLSGMVVVVSAQVALRYGLNTSLDWGEDIARMLFVWSIFLALPLGVNSGAHIGIELLVCRLPDAAQRWLTRLTAALACALMAVVAYQAGVLVLDQWDENLPTLEVSAALFMVPVCIGAAHSVLHLLRLVGSGVAPKQQGSAE